MSNLLQYEKSAYLQQHKDNPIEWYPWCDEAFKRAMDEKKPIFISIGYSSCHWCHVMEKEVFEDEKIAEFMNKNFISIKVDREERPDIDKHYQELYRLLNRRAGGWPTSIFCTPERKSIFAGTYIPIQSKDRQMGFTELTKLISEKVSSNDKKLFENADEIETFLHSYSHPKEATKLNFTITQTMLSQCKHNFDNQFGGFSEQPKFPQTSTLTALSNIYLLTDDSSAKEMVTKTLLAMQRGGLHDIIDGGFCRYSVDKEWLVPHFEKMGYDNALLCSLYTKAYHIFNIDSFRQTALSSAEFMLYYMSEKSLFYSASDADSDGTEGYYFTYRYDEAYSLLQDSGFQIDKIKQILSTLNISENGNFDRRSIVRLDTAKRPEWFEEVKSLLSSLRKQNSYPPIDKKIQTSWNAMMIKALFELSDITPKYCHIATEHLDALLKTMIVEDTLYHSTHIGSAPQIEAFLEDYAYLGIALICAYQYTNNEIYLIEAQKVANGALEKFYDRGLWYFSRAELEVRADTADSSYPSSIGVVTDLLLSLGSLVDEKYRHFAFKTLQYYSYDLARKPIHAPYLFNQAVRFIKEDRIIKTKLSLKRTHYPFVLKKYDETIDGYLICGNKSCFASTSNPDKIDLLIKESID